MQCPFAGALFYFLQVVATGSVSLAMVPVSEGELYRHLIAMLSASELSSMDGVSGRIIPNTCKNHRSAIASMLSVY